MKGVVFVALAEMMQNNYGHRTWNDILEKSQLESQGIYTVAETYKDEEAIKLLQVISVKLNKSSDDVLKLFGFFLFFYFSKHYPHFFHAKKFSDFLLSVDEIIHTEIKKISPSSNPPQIKATIINDHNINVSYSSNRKLCSLAIGLIKGAAKMYGHSVVVEHLQCMHDGHQKCELLLKIDR